MILAAAVVVFGVAGYLIVGGLDRKATVRIRTNPADADVMVGSERCHAPCVLKLTPGQYQLRADHSGYQSSTTSVSIAADTQQLPVITLPVITPPVLPQPAPPPGDQQVAVEPGGETSDTVAGDRHEPAAPSRGDVKRPPVPVSSQNSNGPANKAPVSTEHDNPVSAAQIQKLPAVASQVQPQPTTPTPSTTNLVAANTQPSQPVTGTGGASIPPTRVDAAPANTTAPSDLSSQEQTDIQSLLGRYADAVARKDTKSIQNLWPGVPKEKMKSFKQAFEMNTRLSFSNWHFFKEDNERVRVSCVQKVQAMLDGKESTFDKPFTLYVRRKGSGWQIDYIPLND
jgi:PEGA domain